MQKSSFTKQAKKHAKAMHKAEQRLEPTWFETKRVDLGSEIVTEVTKRPPSWGGFNFVFTKTGI